MARALTAPGPLDTLEESFDLLQRAPASVWFRYLAGAAPLIVGLLFVWNEFSSPSTANPVIASLFLVAILVWFYRCRQVFSGHLRRILGSPYRRLTAPDTPTPSPSWALASFEGTKLLAMPIAALSLLPLAYATAFYRSLTLFSGQGLSPLDAARKAWKTAAAWQRENWFILAIVNLLAVTVFINVAVTVILAPMLVKIFTGYESIFTQRGPATLSIQFPIILALTWLCFDPLLQAVYIVRAFKWEGLSTGEDLLVRLQRIAPIILLFALCASTCRLSAAPPALSRDTLNQSIDQALQSPEYDWRTPPPDTAKQTDWFLDTVDHVVAGIEKAWKVLSDLFSDVVDWISRMLRPLMPPSGKDSSGQPRAVRPVFVGLGIVILALALLLLWKFRPRRKASLPIPVASPAIDLNNEALLASDLPEDEWLRMAERYADSGDLRLALRALYLGTLALLSRRGFLTIHACKSNRDYLRELSRRSRDAALSRIFGVNLRSFEQSWYGFHEVTGDQLRDFRDNLGRMRS